MNQFAFYLCGGIEPDVKVIQESVFCRKCSNCHDAIEKFCELREYRRTGHGFHAAKIPSCMQISERKLPVGKDNDDHGNKEPREYYAAQRISENHKSDQLCRRTI